MSGKLSYLCGAFRGMRYTLVHGSDTYESLGISFKGWIFNTTTLQNKDRLTSGDGT